MFSHLLESLIYNNLETKIKAVKVSAGAISACLEKFRSDSHPSVLSRPTGISLFRQSPRAICKDYELLVMSCCLMQLLDSVGQNQKLERLMGLEKVLERSSSCSFECDWTRLLRFWCKLWPPMPVPVRFPSSCKPWKKISLNQKSNGLFFSCCCTSMEIDCVLVNWNYWITFFSWCTSILWRAMMFSTAKKKKNVRM